MFDFIEEGTPHESKDAPGAKVSIKDDGDEFSWGWNDDPADRGLDSKHQLSDRRWNGRPMSKHHRKGSVYEGH